MNKAIRTIPAETMNAMVHYAWPGNVRELQNVIERAVILSTGSVLKVSSADLKTSAARGTNQPAESSISRAINRAIREVPPPNRDVVMETLRATGGQVGGTDGAAARLGMKRTTLIAHMKRLGINPRTVINHF
jgi:DNA-binding NtrC family response regulator